MVMQLKLSILPHRFPTTFYCDACWTINKGTQQISFAGCVYYTDEYGIWVMGLPSDEGANHIGASIS